MDGAPILRAAWLSRMVAAPVVAGLLLFWWLGAPRHYAIVNGAAFLIGVAAIRFGRLPRGAGHRRILAAILLGLLALPLVTGPEIQGIARWIPLGPLHLNAGLLVVPLIAVIAVRDAAMGWLILLAALIIAAVQPDAAATAALSLALLAWAWTFRDWRAALSALVGAAVTAWAFANGALPPVPFVEGLVPMLWHDLARPVHAVGLAALLGVPLVYFLTGSHLHRQDGLMLAATYGGFLAASFAGPYPAPLAGYGAASIIGLMAAIGCATRLPDSQRTEIMPTPR